METISNATRSDNKQRSSGKSNEQYYNTTSGGAAIFARSRWLALTSLASLASFSRFRAKAGSARENHEFSYRVVVPVAGTRTTITPNLKPVLASQEKLFAQELRGRFILNLQSRVRAPDRSG